MASWTDEREGEVMIAKNMTDGERLEKLEKDMASLKGVLRTIGGKLQVHSDGIMTPGLKALMVELGRQLYAAGKEGGE